MALEKPEVVIRFGSHAEKDYVLKLSSFLDGLILGANLLEATPGASASLLLKVGAKDARFFIDPMTYAYGAYIDPSSGSLRVDLDWIKSDQTRKDAKGDKHTVRDFKRSYRELSTQIGRPLVEALDRSRAISPDKLASEKQQVDFCGSVTDYQLDRIARILEEDSELKDFVPNIPRPAAVFAPYFYLEPTHTDEWLALNLKLMEITANLGLGVPVHGILCADIEHLKNAEVRVQLADLLPKTGVAGVWLWFSAFLEESAPREVLLNYRELVRELSNKVEVHAMHGGFFSLCLSKYGMQGVSHGVGYGEQKDVVPVIGQSTPTVRFYLPPLARRLGVPNIERAFDALGVRTPQDFHDKVCNCAVCRGVVSNSLDEFSAFGQMRLSRTTAKRAAQTPAAAKRCRFHFLLCRLRERDELRSVSLDHVVRRLQEAAATWGVQPSLSMTSDHLSRWSDVLRQSI